MTKEERRIRKFASGLANLGGQSRDYLQNLTKALFVIEKMPVSPLSGAGNAFAPEKESGQDRYPFDEGVKKWL